MIPYNLQLFSPLVIQFFTGLFVSPLFTNSQEPVPLITNMCDETFDNYLFTYNKTYDFVEYENVWFKGDFNRADEYAKIEENKKYRVKGYGVRLPFLGMYHKIYDVKEV